MTELPESQFDEERVREDGIDKDIILSATLTLSLKLRLEKRLRKKLGTRYKKYLNEIIRTYEKYGHLPMMVDLRNDIENILNDHYIFVGSAFDSFSRNQLGAKDDPGFDKRLEALIKVRAFNRAHQSANKVVRTNEKDIDNTLRLVLATAAAAGFILTNKQIARQIKPILAKLFETRINTISPTETAVAAEQTKADELGEMFGMNIFLEDGRRMEEVTARKQWVARFINTRPWHEDAHGQTVDVTSPYIVNGELLMFPTDASLGASPNNVINCYCSSQNLLT